MFGPQVLLELDAERRVPIYKCVVCDFETPDRVVEARHVEQCGATVLKEHHAMAKLAWLNGLAELKRRRAERGKKKCGAAVGANQAMASERQAATESHSEAPNGPQREVGAGLVSSKRLSPASLAIEAAAPTSSL